MEESFLFYLTSITSSFVGSTLILLNEWNVPMCIFFFLNLFSFGDLCVIYMAGPLGLEYLSNQNFLCLIMLVNRKITGCVEDQRIKEQ